MTFEWDTSNTEHIAKHGVTTEEVESFFLFPRYEETEVVRGEQRIWALGRTVQGRYLTVVYTIRETKIRVVTAHTAKRSHRRFYEELIASQNE